LRELTEALTQAQCWEQAEAVARSIEQGDQQAWALRVLAGALSQAQRWEQAEAVARSIELRHEKAWALRVLAGALSQAQCEEHADTVWQEAEKAVRSIEQYDSLGPGTALEPGRSDLARGRKGSSFYQRG
jgi:hypothetical protein